MTTNDIIEELKARDKLADDMKVDIQLLIWSANRVGRMLGNIDRQEKPGCADDYVRTLEERINSITSKYDLDPKTYL